MPTYTARILGPCGTPALPHHPSGDAVVSRNRQNARSRCVGRFLDATGFTVGEMRRLGFRVAFASPEASL